MLDEDAFIFDVPEDARAALVAAGASWADEETAEAYLRDALRLAPDALAVRIGAYKFYFYRHRLEEALPYALGCMELAARRLQLPHDWHDVRPDDAAFSQIERWPRLYVQSLIAYGYSLLRLGRLDDGRAALAHAARLDPADRFGAARLVAVVDRGGVDEDEDEDD